MSAWSVNGPHLTDEVVHRRRLKGERMTLVVCPHQGMGDHLICQGMYRTLAEDWDLEFLILEKYAANVRTMLADVPNIRYIPIKTEEVKDQYCDGICDRVILRIGFSAKTAFDTNIFDREFYRHAQVPWEYRWSRFVVPDVPQAPAPSYKYVFVHDRPEMFNAKLTIPGIHPDPNYSIFAHRDLILNAQEIHCVSSAFAAFAESLPLNGKPLHFYRFTREVPEMHHNWIIHP